jgi:hypothetical protein
MRTRILAAALIAATLAVPLAAQAPNPEPRLDAAARAALVDSAASLLRRYYVFADTGQMLADHLHRRLAAGAFDAAQTAAQLGDVLTREMQAFNHDGHLYTRYQPGAFAAGRMPGGPVVRGSRPRDPAREAALRRANYNIDDVEVLDGNVGYVRIGALMDSPESRQAFDAAMAFLGNVDAMIIDLRRSPGGDQMAHYVASYFLPDGAPQTWNYARMMGDTMKNVSGPVAGRKRLDIPVYVLTSGRTASAAEALAQSLQSNHRAKVVGEHSAGAGYNNFFFPLSDDLGMSVSIGRAFFPTTNQGWEGTGVLPDIAAAPAQALAAAHVDALNALAARETDDAHRRQLQWTAQYGETLLHPYAVPPAALQAYAGTYGTRRVAAEDGGLVYYRRPDGPGDPLRPIADGVFAPGADERVEFVRDGSGAVTGLRDSIAAGGSNTYPRVP